MTVDAHEFIEFSLKTSLTIAGLAGSDVVNLNNPTAPDGTHRALRFWEATTRWATA